MCVTYNSPGARCISAEPCSTDSDCPPGEFCIHTCGGLLAVHHAEVLLRALRHVSSAPAALLEKEVPGTHVSN